MKALVIGAGGREHALAWRLRNSTSVKEVYACPGNPGIAQVANCIPVQDYVAIAEQLCPDLTVVGPEAPLVDGIVDRFRTRGLAIVGPNAANAFCHVAHGADCKASLPSPARSGQCHQRCLGQQAADVRQLLLPADKAAQLSTERAARRRDRWRRLVVDRRWLLGKPASYQPGAFDGIQSQGVCQPGQGRRVGQPPQPTLQVRNRARAQPGSLTERLLRQAGGQPVAPQQPRQRRIGSGR